MTKEEKTGSGKAKDSRVSKMQLYEKHKQDEIDKEAYLSKKKI